MESDLDRLEDPLGHDVLFHAPLADLVEDREAPDREGDGEERQERRAAPADFFDGPIPLEDR